MTTYATGKPLQMSKLTPKHDNQHKKLPDRITDAPIVVVKALTAILSAVIEIIPGEAQGKHGYSNYLNWR